MATKATTTANKEDPATQASPTAVGDETGATVKPPKRQRANGVYYLVNPAGAIHSVDRDHAAWRLRSPGWRLAEEDEIETYVGQKLQRADRPICQKWSPDPDEQLEDVL